MRNEMECLGCGLRAPLPAHDEEADKLPARRATAIQALESAGWRFGPELCARCAAIAGKRAPAAEADRQIDERLTAVEAREAVIVEALREVRGLLQPRGTRLTEIERT